MAANNTTISASPSPAPYDTEQSGENGLTSEAVNYLLLVMRDIIDERIEKRINDGQDIAKVYSAEITSKTSESIVVGTVTIDGTAHNVTERRLTSITVRYNDDDYADITGDSVTALTEDDKWIKIATYDGVNFYALHRM